MLFFSIKNLEEKNLKNRNITDFAAKLTRKAKEKCWMQEVRTISTYGFNDRIADEFKGDNKNQRITIKFLVFYLKKCK